MGRASNLIAVIAAMAGLPGLARAASFDGTWSVTQDCEAGRGGARGYKWSYDATIKEGQLVAQYGVKDNPSSQTLTGRIQPDGSGSLIASGLTGKSDYTAGFGQPGEKYVYSVVVRFEAARGTGLRTQGRTCRFSFVKH